jgi:membrane protease YdiL (CAAX protease family)
MPGSIRRLAVPWLWVVVPLAVMLSAFEFILTGRTDPTVAMLMSYGIMVAAIAVRGAVAGDGVASTFGTEFGLLRTLRYLLVAAGILLAFVALYYLESVIRFDRIEMKGAWYGKGSAFSFVMQKVFIVAFIEEWYFRGYAYRIFSGSSKACVSVFGLRLSYAVICSALAFVTIHIGHGEPLMRCLTFFPGLFFGFLRERTGNIMAPVIAHASCNILVPYFMPVVP